MKSLTNQLARKFKLNIRFARVIQPRIYYIRLNNGKRYVLKPMPYPVPQIRWIDRTLIKVRKNGFHRIAWRNPNKGERAADCFRFNSVLNYIVNPWVKGRLASPRSLKDMRACGIALAQFHQAGHRTAIPQKGRINALGSWTQEFQSLHKRLQIQVRKGKQGKYRNSIDTLLQKHGQELLAYSYQAQQLLRSSPYKQACARAKKTLPLCHGDGGPTNFILSNGKATLIDFETLKVDLRAYDLYRLLYNSCKENSWRMSTARALLDGYQSVVKLNQIDFKLAKIWLRFPRTTYLMLKAYPIAAKQDKKEIIRDLPKAIAAERKITSFLKKLDSYSRNG